MDLSAFSESVQSLISAGTIKVKEVPVNVPGDKSPNGKELNGTAVIVDETPDLSSTVALYDGKLEEVLGAAVAYRNTQLRTNVRNALLREAEGPEAKLRQAAKRLQDTGLPIYTGKSIEQIVDMIRG